MSELDHGQSEVTNKTSFRYLLFVMCLVQIVDSYCTVFPGAIPSLIANEFLSGYTIDEQNSIMALANGLVSIGMLFLFFSQYLADRIGRKKMLAITVAGLAFSSLGMFLSVNFFMYMLFVFFISFFFASDIWFLYLNEESKPEKRAYYANIALIVGLLGPIFMVISRGIFITESSSDWRGMTLFPIILGFPLVAVILLTIKESSQYQQMKREASFTIKRSLLKDVGSLFKTENRKAYISLVIITFIWGFSSIYILLFEKYVADVSILTQGQVTIIFLIVIFIVLLAYLINGLLADRIGRKPLYYLWSILAPISVIIWVVGATIPQYAFLLTTIGYSMSHLTYWGILGVIRLSTIELLPTDRRGTGIGFRALIGTSGRIISLLISSVVILFVGLGTTFIIFILGNLIIIPLVLFSLKETKGIKLMRIK